MRWFLIYELKDFSCTHQGGNFSYHQDML